jgi:hypothetical protein
LSVLLAHHWQPFWPHVPAKQTSPKQHGRPTSPQTEQDPEGVQTYPLPQKPLLADWQQGSAAPPQGTHCWSRLLVANAAVHPASGHAGWLLPPHVPADPTQLPLVQVPSPPGHAPPSATQSPFPTQHPRLSHQLPSQHFSPGAPQATQAPVLHTCLGEVQKSLAPPAPGQHCSPGPPQPPQLPLEQRPRLAVQGEPEDTQSWPEQHEAALQVVLAQQGWPGAPQDRNAPATQTPAGLAPLSPGGIQRLPSGHAPSRHAAPEQGGS